MSEPRICHSCAPDPLRTTSTNSVCSEAIPGSVPSPLLQVSSTGKDTRLAHSELFHLFPSHLFKATPACHSASVSLYLSTPLCSLRSTNALPLPALLSLLGGLTIFSEKFESPTYILFFIHSLNIGLLNLSSESGTGNTAEHGADKYPPSFRDRQTVIIFPKGSGLVHSILGSKNSALFSCFGPASPPLLPEQAHSSCRLSFLYNS